MSNRNKNMGIMRAKLQKQVHERRRAPSTARKTNGSRMTRLQQLRRPAIALEIGDGAIEGERRAKCITKAGREQIGIAVALARRGLLAAMPDNQVLLIHTWRTSHRAATIPHTRSNRDVD
jgi:hypothetical protein